MDETVYQCPECNFNADNLTELDGHITGKRNSIFSYFSPLKNNTSAQRTLSCCRPLFKANKILTINC